MPAPFHGQIGPGLAPMHGPRVKSVPLALQERVRVPSKQGAPQLSNVFEPGRQTWQPRCPSQASEPEHSLAGSAFRGTAVQLPDALHDSQRPEQGALQQTPSRQLPDVHWLAELHAAPRGSSTL